MPREGDQVPYAGDLPSFRARHDCVRWRRRLLCSTAHIPSLLTLPLRFEKVLRMHAFFAAGFRFGPGHPTSPAG